MLMQVTPDQQVKGIVITVITSLYPSISFINTMNIIMQIAKRMTWNLIGVIVLYLIVTLSHVKDDSSHSIVPLL